MSKPEEHTEPYHICTAKNPWNQEMKIPAQHPDAFVLTQMFYVEEEYDVLFCPYCQNRFTTLVPR